MTRYLKTNARVTVCFTAKAFGFMFLGRRPNQITWATTYQNSVGYNARPKVQTHYVKCVPLKRERSTVSKRQLINRICENGNKVGAQCFIWTSVCRHLSIIARLCKTVCVRAYVRTFISISIVYKIFIFTLSIYKHVSLYII